MPAPMPAAAVIIPHYNDVARLTRCLAALLQGDVSGAEIIVVDNGSDSPLDAVIAAHPAVRFVTEPQKGAAAARNRGVAETTAPRLCFLDADCVPAADWLARTAEVAAQGDIVGGAVDVFDETAPPRSGAEAFEAVFGFDYRGYIERDGFAVTANLVTRRAVFDAVGPFRPGLAEDIDWCRRAVAMGYTLVCADALRVGHPSRSDWPALRHKWRRMVREGFALRGTSPTGRLRWAVRLCWALRAIAMIPSIAVHAPRILTSPQLDSPSERLAALATLVRLRILRCGWMLWQAAGGRL